MKQGELKEINILRRKIKVELRSRDNLKGLTVGEKLSYVFYDGLYQDNPMLFLVPRKANPTPKECRITADRVFGLFGLPVVFVLNPGPTYERQRLVDKAVYFVMSDRYANLPMLVALEKPSDRKKAALLTPVAQYILLYHLQVRSLDGFSAKDIAEWIPYSYSSTSLGITCLADVGLCRKVQCGQRNKVLAFDLKGRALWNAAEAFLSSPLLQRLYCDQIHVDMEFPTCGINALAHYTCLNPDSEKMIVLDDKEYRSLKASGAFVNLNEYDGDVVVEVWKYPVVGMLDAEKPWVDRLSLALALQSDCDPRVEKELERLVKEMQWKD